VVVVATLGNTLGSLIAYGIGAWGGRPFLERYGRYLLIRPHDIEIAERFFVRWGARPPSSAACSRSCGPSSASPAGVARMPIRTFVAYSVAGAFLWSAVLTWAGVQLGERWEDIRHALQPFDLVIGLVVVAGLASCSGFAWAVPSPGAATGHRTRAGGFGHGRLRLRPGRRRSRVRRRVPAPRATGPVPPGGRCRSRRAAGHRRRARRTASGSRSGFPWPCANRRR